MIFNHTPTCDSQGDKQDKQKNSLIIAITAICAGKLLSQCDVNRIKCGHSEGLFVDKVTTPVRASVSMFTASVFSNLFRELSTSSSLVVGIVCVHCSRRVFERQGEPSNEENHLVYISKFLSIVNAFVDTIQAVNSTPKITTTS